MGILISQNIHLSSQYLRLNPLKRVMGILMILFKPQVVRFTSLNPLKRVMGILMFQN